MLLNSGDRDVEIGLTSSTCLVEPKADGSLVMAVENHTSCPVRQLDIEASWKKPIRRNSM